MDPMVAHDWPPDDFLAALGSVTLTWATSEDCIDSLCVLAFAKLGAKVAFPKHSEIPRSISRKISYLRLCFSGLHPMAPWEAVALPLLAETRELSLKRHSLVHGALSAWDDKGVTLIGYRREAEWLTTERHKVTTAELLSLRDQLFALAVAWLRIAQPIFSVEFPDRLHSPHGEVSG